jgi:hypothetical protein
MGWWETRRVMMPACSSGATRSADPDKLGLRCPHADDPVPFSFREFALEVTAGNFALAASHRRIVWIDRLTGGLSDTGKRLSAEDGERGASAPKPVQISGLEKASEIKADVTAARDDIRAVTAPSRRTNYALVVIARVFFASHRDQRMECHDGRRTRGYGTTGGLNRSLPSSKRIRPKPRPRLSLRPDQSPSTLQSWWHG